MTKRLIVTPKENGWYYILDTEHNQRVGVQKDGVLKVKRFKSLVGANAFIKKIEFARSKNEAEQRLEEK